MTSWMRQQTRDGCRPAQIENIKRQSLDYFPKFWLHAKDDVAFQASKVEADSAAELSDYIVYLITQKENKNTIQMQPLHDPINSGDTPSITVHQVGNHHVFIGNINGDVRFGL